MVARARSQFGIYLRDRRTRLDPAAFGFNCVRRRTPGLRREEVAQRANISATWYTWLEQGRGGAPSADVLDRIADALMLTEPEREQLFLLGLGRVPEMSRNLSAGLTSRLQRVLDAFEASLALIKTECWDVVAWNPAATALIAEFHELPPDGRNMLRFLFGDAPVRAVQEEWKGLARLVIRTLRADVARGGTEVIRRTETLSHTSIEFNAFWHDVEPPVHGRGTSDVEDVDLGLLKLSFSLLRVEERPDLTMVIGNAASQADADRIRALRR